MFFATSTTAGRLPEKPWRAEAVARFVAAVIICWMMGGLAGVVLGYFHSPDTSSATLFVAFIAGALVSFVAVVILLLRQWPADDYIFRLAWICVCFCAAMIFSYFADRYLPEKIELGNSASAVLIGGVSFQGAVIFLALFLLREHRIGWGEGFGFVNHPMRAALIGICAGAVAVPFAWLFQAASARLLERLTLQHQEQDVVTILRGSTGIPSMVALGIVTIIIAPVGEEVLFRGILYPAIKRTGHPQLALWSTALLFGLIHANLASFVPLTLLAVLLVWLYEYTGSLLAPIVTHSLFNALNFVAVYLVQK
jgi:membrane protease YdiL (CAAX protease family)